MVEIEDWVEFSCMECGCSKKPEKANAFYMESHQCMKHRRPFQIREKRTTLEELDDTLQRKRGIAPGLVEELVKKACTRKHHRRKAENKAMAASADLKPT